MKKSFFWGLLYGIGLSVLIAGCGKQSSANKTEQQNAQVKESVAEQKEEEPVATEEKTIGILMPTGKIQRWNDDAFYMQSQLEAEGYKVEVYFSQNDVKIQKKQFRKFVKEQMDCIVIAPVQSSGMAKAANKAKEAGIPVISYDRLLCDTNAVDYYITFDNRKAGKQIARRMIQEANLEQLETRSYRTIEFFMGPAEDFNAKYLYQGMMKVLKPYLEEGQLVCKSGNTSLRDTEIADWSEKKARKKCHNILQQYYTEETLDLVASAFDPFSYACIDELKKAGYTLEKWPIISGQDSEAWACNQIREGWQTFSIFKDTRILAQRCASTVKALCEGEEVLVDDRKHFNNHVKKIPTIICETELVDKDNMQELLVDSGYYTLEQIQGK